ncbi:hypothetical protein F5I97DRAFT_1873173 [Phlebopus sp. FC_14]|nr:hypothetical protein F5I97DRAFT_1873173 [Phlebopus sp. FC_14]
MQTKCWPILCTFRFDARGGYANTNRNKLFQGEFQNVSEPLHSVHLPIFVFSVPYDLPLIMSLSSVLQHPGLALYSIPVMYGLAFVPALFRNAIVGRSVGYDNVAPRGNVARVRDAEVAALVKRIDGAHQNGIEIFPLWAAAVVRRWFFSVLTWHGVNCIYLSFSSRALLPRWIPLL